MIFQTVKKKNKQKTPTQNNPKKPQIKRINYFWKFHLLEFFSYVLVVEQQIQVGEQSNYAHGREENYKPREKTRKKVK